MNKYILKIIAFYYQLWFVIKIRGEKKESADLIH